MPRCFLYGYGHVYELPVVNLGQDTSICQGGASLTIRNLAPPPAGKHSYTWNTGDTTPELRVVHPGTYTLTVDSDPIGCSATESVTVQKDCYIDIPNAFTPNGDGENDYFFPRSILSKSVRAFRLQVWNRWGQLVFETERTDGRGWDGRLNGKDQPLGAYIYNIEATFNNGREERYTGNVTLIR